MNRHRIVRAFTILPLPFALITGHSAFADPPRPSPFLSRAVVTTATRLAIAHAGLQPDRTRELGSRARVAGLLPSLSVRVMRGLGASTAATIALPSTDRFASDDSLVIDVRAQFDLDRLVFDRSEVTLERIETVRAERRDALEREIIDALALLTRAQAVLASPNVSPADAAEAQIVTARAQARVEALTGVGLPALLDVR